MRYRFDRGVATKIKKFQTKFINSTVALVVAVTGLGAGLPVLLEHTVFALNPANEYVSTSGTDSGDCSTSATACATITYALTKAGNGTVIHVGAGTFNENFTVNQSVTLKGAGEANTTISAPASLPTGGAIIAVDGSSTSANISDLTVSGPGPTACGSMGYGIYVKGGAYANINTVAVTNITDSTFSGCQNGVAIEVGRQHDSTTGTATINNVTITGYQKNGITVDNTGSHATIVHTTVTGHGSTSVTAQNGIQVSRGATATIKDDTITGNSYGNTVSNGATAAGILLYGAGDHTVVQNNTVTNNQIGYYTEDQANLKYLSLSGITGNTRDAVAWTTADYGPAWPTPTATYADAALTGGSDNIYGSDIVETQGHLHVWSYDAFKTVQAALNAVATNGRVYVADGTYTENLNISKNGLKIYGQSEASTIVDTTSGYGVNIDHQNHSRLDSLTFNSTGNNGYALHAYGVNGLSLNNLTFDGSGSTNTGGVDVNSSQNVSYNNVTASHFAKNGFSVTAKYASTDNYSRNLTFNGITADSNGWNGIAFYTTNNSGNYGHNITGVRFNGTNTISNNGTGSNPSQGGIFVEGDSDYNYFLCVFPYTHSCSPSNTVTSPGGTLLLGNTNFSGNNGNDIVNFQTAPVDGLSATFDGKTGNQMTASERSAEDGMIFDKLDNSALGLVKYYNLPTNLRFVHGATPVAAGSTVNYTDVTLKWDTVPNTERYQVEVTAPDGSVQSHRYTGWYTFDLSDHSRYGFFDTQQGTWSYRIRSKDATTGVWSDWTAPISLTYDHQSPKAWFTATPPTYVNGNFDVQGAASDNVALAGAFFDVRDPHDTTGNSWRAGCVNGTFTSVPAPIAGSTSATLSCTINTANLTEGYTYTLRIHTGDYANYGGGQQYNLIVDRTKPTVKMNLDRNGYLSNGGVTGKVQNPEIEAFDANLTEIQITDKNGTEVTHWGNGKSSVTPGKTTYKKVGWLGEGTYKVYAYDAAGNVSDAFTFTIDNTPPAVPTNLSWLDSNSNPATNGFTNVQKGSLSWQDSDASTDHYVYKFWTNIAGYFNDANNPWTTDNPVYFSGASIWTNFDNKEGTYYFCVEAIDAVGNTSACSDTYTVTYDKTAPNAPTASPVGGDFQSSPTVTLSANDNTGGSGIASIYYTTDGNTPDKTSTLYTDPITVSTNTTIKAIAYDKAGNNSPVMIEAYTITQNGGQGGNGGFGGQVLGDQTTTPNTSANDSQNNGQVQGDQTTNQNNDSNNSKNKSTSNSSNFLGLGWWWLLVLAVILGFLWLVLGKAGSDDKKA